VFFDRNLPLPKVNVCLNPQVVALFVRNCFIIVAFFNNLAVPSKLVAFTFCQSFAYAGEKPYKCLYCEKCFSDKGACNSHIRVHTREETCSCPYCGQTFSKKQVCLYHYFPTGNKSIMPLHESVYQKPVLKSDEFYKLI